MLEEVGIKYQTPVKIVFRTVIGDVSPDVCCCEELGVYWLSEAKEVLTSIEEEEGMKESESSSPCSLRTLSCSE